MQENEDQKLHQYILDVKKPNEEVYNANTHAGWQAQEFSKEDGSPLKWSVFKITFEDGRVVYSYSNEKGVVAMPSSDEDYALVIDIAPTSIKSKLKYYASITLIIALIVFAVLFDLFGGSIIAYFKAKNDPLRKAQKRASKNYVTYNNMVFDKQEAIRKANPYLYVYTNDTASLSFGIYPNIDHYRNPYAPGFVNTQNKASELESFVNNEHKRGYNVRLNTEQKRLLIANYKPIDTAEISYKIVQTYLYTDKEKEIVKRARARGSKLSRLRLRKLPHIDSLQTSIVLLSKKEFESGQYKHPMKKLFAPRINLKNPTHKFYFSVYSNNVTKQQLQDKIDIFRKNHLNSQKCDQCQIRKVRQKYK